MNNFGSTDYNYQTENTENYDYFILFIILLCSWLLVLKR